MSERALLDTAVIRTNFALNVASVESPEHVTAGMEQGYEMFDLWLTAHDVRIRREALTLSDDELDNVCRLMLKKSSERACRSCLRGALAALAEARERSNHE